MTKDLLVQLSLPERLVSLVENKWDDQKKPYLLSKLGEAEGGGIAKDIKSSKMSMREYITEFLADQLTLVSHSSNRVIIGAVPKNDETKSISDFDPYFKLGQSSKSSNLRIFPIFWKAFRKPPEKDKERVISFAPKASFFDLDKPVELKDEQFIIAPKFISYKDEADDEVYADILKWCEEKSIPPERLLAQNIKFRRKDHSEGQPNNILDLLFSILDERELKRVSIPLDIANKLGNAKI